MLVHSVFPGPHRKPECVRGSSREWLLGRGEQGFRSTYGQFEAFTGQLDLKERQERRPLKWIDQWKALPDGKGLASKVFGHVCSASVPCEPGLVGPGRSDVVGHVRR